MTTALTARPTVVSTIAKGGDKPILHTTIDDAINAAAFKGKGKASRELAFIALAPTACSAERGKAHLVEQTRIALGVAPTESQVTAIRREITIGLAMARMPAGEYPKGCIADGDKLIYVRSLVFQYIAPPKEGAKANKVPLDKLGRRSPVQQRVIRNAEESASKVLAELSLSAGETVKAAKAKAKAKRAAQPGGHVSKEAPPEHAALVKPAAPVAAQDYVQHMQTQLAALCDYDRKNAKIRPVTHGEFAEALAALKQVANKAANAFAEREAAAK
jgi:hypothetical protein